MNEYMEHYVTLFDSLFLPQGLALHNSMERFIKVYKLWILCVDDEVYLSLSKLNLDNVQLLQLRHVETEDLIRVKSTRSKGEYCWTLTPFAATFAFNSDKSITRITYIDADTWFLSSPQIAFEELEKSGKSVLITKHAYSSDYEFSNSSGIFCVQFMTFVRGDSDDILRWWQDRCIEWCYNYYEDGKFGDQLYLNSWPTLFPTKVHILSYGGFTLAPWNVQRFPYSDAFLFHFQGLRIINRNSVVLGPALATPSQVLTYIYKPYLLDIKSSLLKMDDYDISIKSQRTRVKFYEQIIALARELRRIYFKIGRYIVIKI